MNNYYTLIYLNREIKEKIVEGIFNFAISPHKDVIELYIETAGEKFRLIFSTDSRETAIFLDSYRPPKKRNVIEFFPELERNMITDVRLADKDRLLYICFEDERHLLFKLFSGHPNVYLVENSVIVDAFKNPEKAKGSNPPEPYAPGFSDEISPRKNPKNQITDRNPLLPRNLLPYLIDQHRVDEMDTAEVITFTDNITEALLEDPHPRVLETGDFCLWSQEWLGIPSEKECNSVNDCVAFAYKNAVHLRRLHNEKEDVEELLKRTVTQKKSLIKQLSRAEKSMERSEEYEKYGHLLMAHAHEEKHPGTEQITVSDLYDEKKEITISLKEDKSIAGNAEMYYEKSRDAKKSYLKAKERLPRVKEELKQARGLLDELEQAEHLSDLRDWIKDHKEVLSELGYGGSDEKQASSPYRKFQAGKYEIWIGKSAKSNDQLTSLAHKEDIWLHARGVAGSHVVIRMGNQKEYPPKGIILRAASYAAYYSKARGMKTAPVMYTKRKYVRKARGAGPGAVTVEREQVEMVPPMSPGEKS